MITLLATGHVDNVVGVIGVIVELLGLLGLTPLVVKLWEKIKAKFLTIDKIIQDANADPEMSYDDKIGYVKHMCRKYKIHYDKNKIQAKINNLT
jgi:hypothetical protein